MVLFIGFDVSVDEQALANSPAPVADARLKDPAKIAEDLVKKAADRKARASQLPIYGTIRQIAVLSSDEGATALYTSDLKAVITLLNDYAAKCQRVLADGTMHFGRIGYSGFGVFGVDVRAHIRQLHLAGAAAGSQLARSLWYESHNVRSLCIDPYDFIIKAEHQADISEASLCSYLRVPALPPLATALEKATYAKNLITIAGY